MNQSDFLDKQIQRVHDNTALFKSTFSEINELELNWQPNSDTWSVGACIDHINTSNRVYFKLFEQLTTQQYRHRLYERLPGLAKLFGMMVLNACHPETQKKNKTLAVFQPKQTDYQLSILKEFCDTNAQLSTYFEQLKSIPSLDINITSPATSIVVMPLVMIFDILIFHEQRHFNQAERILTLFREQGEISV